MRGLLVVSFFLVVQCSCSHIFNIQQKKPNAEDLIVKMRRTACYGTCPQYEIHIYNKQCKKVFILLQIFLLQKIYIELNYISN